MRAQCARGGGYTPELVVSAISAALRFSLAGPADPLAQLRGRLRDAELLLVLDNCQTCIARGAAAGRPGSGLSLAADPGHQSGAVPCPRGAPLSRGTAVDGSSRARSGAVAAGDKAAGLASAPTVALFAERARCVRPDFTLTAENIVAVAEICERLDGLPLAIELAAAHSGAFSPQALLARLSSRLALLIAGPAEICLRVNAPAAPRLSGAMPCSARRRADPLPPAGRLCPGGVRSRRQPRCVGMTVWMWEAGSKRCSTRGCCIAHAPMTVPAFGCTR